MYRAVALTACLASALQLPTRRQFGLGVGTAVVVPPALAAGGKVVVVGGAGFVGTEISHLLATQGVSVVSVSRRSAAAQAQKVQYEQFVDFVSLDASKDDLSNVFKGASAVISCVGVAPGQKNQLDGNGAVNERIADAAKKAKVGRLVYISVASAISEGTGKLLFADYVKGKAQAEAAVQRNYGGGSSLIIRPGVISGGGPGLPPPPGVPPVPVDAVARAAVAGALGKKSGILDGRDEIVRI
jgi:nucleoside-diphosphate-sugar epimerase